MKLWKEFAAASLKAKIITRGSRGHRSLEGFEELVGRL
jgi:hypothetical protein